MRRIFSAAAALALAVGATLLGAGTALADTGTMTLDDPTTHYTIGQNDGLTITGTTTNQSSFTAASMAGEGLDRIYWDCSVGTIEGGSSFSCTLPTSTMARPVGDYTLNINEYINGSEDGAQNNAVTVTIQPTALPAPDVTTALVTDPPSGTIEIDGSGGSTDPNARVGVYYDTDGSDGIDPLNSAVCSVTPQSSGDWSCSVTGYSSGSYTFFARQWLMSNGVVTGGTVSDRSSSTASVDLDTSAKPSPIPTLTLGPGTVRVSVELTGGAVDANIQLDTYGDGQTSQYGECGFTPTPDCTYGTVDSPLPPGAYEVITTEEFDGGETSQDVRSIYIPGTPQAPAAVNNGDGTVGLSGTLDPGQSVTPYYGSSPATSTVVCGSLAPDDSGNWSCTTEQLTTGAASFSTSISDPSAAASQVPSNLPYAGGQSALSPATTITITNDAPMPPAMQYTFEPAGITIHGTPTGAGTGVYTRFFSWSPSQDGDGGEGGEGEGGGGFVELSNCPADETGTVSCTFSDLAPGYYNPYSNNVSDDSPSEGTVVYADDYFVVPTTPTVSTGVDNGDSTATLSGAAGSAVPGDRVHVVADGVTDPVCAAIVATDGSWSCTTGALPAVSTTFRAYQEDLAGQNDDILQDDDSIVYAPGGLSAVSANDVVVAITAALVPTTPDAPGTPDAPAAPAAPTTPLPGLTVPVWTFDLDGIDLGNIHPGDKFTITGTGPAGAVVSAELHSTPVNIGTAVVDSAGTFTISGLIPADIETGAHHLTVTMSGTGLVTSSNDRALTIVPVPVPAAARGGQVITTDPSAGESTGAKVHHEGVDPTDPTAPNILSRSIDSIQDVITHPGKIVSAIAIGLVLLIFATLPAHLLNATLAEQYEHLTKRIPRLGRTPRWFARVKAWLAKTPVAGGVVLTTITALLFGFADPDFGFTLASLRLILGLVIALFIVQYVVNAITGLILRRQWSVGVTITMRPLGLILTIVGVIASRLLHFSPGFLVGLVLGLALSGRRASENAWKGVLIHTGLLVALGLGAWVGYSALTSGEPEHETFWTELFVETLVAITTEGIVALLIELLPFRLLEGERLYRKARWLWGVVYLVVIVVFVVAVVPWEGNWEALGSALWIWIAVVAVFAVVCMAVYFYFRFWSPFHETEAEEDENEQEDREPVEIGGGV